MESLTDKIVAIEAKIAENEGLIEAEKIAYLERVAEIKAENKKYLAVAKKLKVTEAQITEIFGGAEVAETE